MICHRIIIISLIVVEAALAAACAAFLMTLAHESCKAVALATKPSSVVPRNDGTHSRKVPGSKKAERNCARVFEALAVFSSVTVRWHF